MPVGPRSSAALKVFWIGVTCGFVSVSCWSESLRLQIIPKLRAESITVECRAWSDENLGSLELGAQITDTNDALSLWKGTLGSFELSAKSERALTETISGIKAEVWNPNHPVLYNLTVTALKNRKVIAREVLRFGFRSFENRQGQFYLNGRPIFLRGIAINPPGRTVPEPTGTSRKFAEDYVRFLKDKNVNIIRLTTDSQVWFDVCDELGMMVYQGQYGSPLGSAEGKQRPPEDFNESMRLYKDLFATYARHPSIIIYVLANELPVSGTRGKAYHDYLTKACAALKAWDPTHLYIGNAGYGEGREGDICDVHRYWGWYYNTFLTYYNLRDQKLFADGPGSVLKGRGPMDEEDNRPRSATARGSRGDEAPTSGAAVLGKKEQSLVTSSATKKRKSQNVVNSSTPGEQPLTFTECVGNFTGPNGEYNLIMRKQLGAQLNWTGHSPNQREDALAYQAFMANQAGETFRRLRPINPHLSGLMPFSIFFYNWAGVTNFNQMKAKPALDALATAYQPVLLSFELWTPNVYSGSVLRPVAHVINDSDNGSGITNANLQCQLRTKEGREVIRLQAVALPKLPYYKTWSSRLELDIPPDLPTGEYILSGLVMTSTGRVLSRNECTVFVAAKRWSYEPRGPLEQDVTLFDPSGRTGRAMEALQLPFRRVPNFRKGLSSVRAVVIGEVSWNSMAAQDGAKLRAYVRNGGHVLCLKQDPAKFDSSWLPEPISFFTASANSPTYPPAGRPFSGDMHINLERPEHAVFNWLTRRHFELWSDYIGWEQTRPGFPQVYPVTTGFKLQKAESLQNTAILADYDRGLEGVGLCEMFDGRGSVVVSGFDIIKRAGLDPVADRFLANLVRYTASQKNHEAHPLIDQAIEWGNYASERGVVTGPLNGLVLNATWVKPPTDPRARPLTQDEGAWNTKPSDQFCPHGRLAFGPYGYSTASGLRDLNADSENGMGFFWARIPNGKRTVLTTVENPTDKPQEMSVNVNDGPAAKMDVPARKTIAMSAPVPEGAATVKVTYSGSKKLVLLRTEFQ